MFLWAKQRMGTESCMQPNAVILHMYIQYNIGQIQCLPRLNQVGSTPNKDPQFAHVKTYSELVRISCVMNFG